ncbi:MAG: CRISPR-associated endonuclease Cas1 [Candidatus Eisenbacteria bacterium]|nr:CRISPR-associated endonuclease Cas1 [Candidatus Eisenbacteria bacterium]
MTLHPDPSHDPDGDPQLDTDSTLEPTIPKIVEPDGADLLPARAVSDYAYCPRSYFIEHVYGEFEHNLETVEGRFRHRRVDTETGATPSAEDLPDLPEIPGTSSRSTAVLLSAPTLGVIAKLDMLEIRDGFAVPIEYKRGSRPPTPEGAWEPEMVQLCLQGLILRENGYKCEAGEIYYAESKERVTIEFDFILVDRTLELLEQARSCGSSINIPPPLVDSPKCPRCSLVGICMPDEVNFLRLRDSLPTGSVRQLVTERRDAEPVYLQTQGLSVGKDGERLQVREKGKVIQNVRLLDVSQLNIYGNIQVSTQTLNELCRWEIPVCFFSYGGWFNGIVQGMGNKNIELRRIQFRTAADPEASLRLAKRFVRGKILNQRTLLRRNYKGINPAVLTELTRFAFTTTRAADFASLLGIEGAAARTYFGNFGSLLRKSTESDLPDFDFSGRNRRPPKDPVNALLSFLYSILTKDLAVTSLSVGFDPLLGFFHQPRYGRPSLALDLMEEFRPLIVDSVVLQLINTGEIRNSDFLVRAGMCTMTPSGRKAALNAYERRMQATITHPLFGYPVTYRRVLEMQCRLLARHLTGEIPDYPIFRTR